MRDSELRRRFRDGDPAAVRAVYRSYGRLVYAVAHKVLVDRVLEGATQQTFVQAWRAAIDIYRRERNRAVNPLGAVSNLPADEQEIVRFQHFEGLTHAQIAERLQLAVGTVKSRSFRAHQRLARESEAILSGDARLVQRAKAVAGRADQLERERETALRAERARIARELHDVVTHSVSGDGAPKRRRARDHEPGRAAFAGANRVSRGKRPLRARRARAHARVAHRPRQRRAAVPPNPELPTFQP